MPESSEDQPPKQSPHRAPNRVVFRKRFQDVARRPLQSFAEILSRDVAGERDFTCLLTTAEEMAELNERFRGKPSATDVLSFPASGEPGYLGDIAISLPHARAQAKEFGHGIDDEIRVLMLHGLLHLIGLDHEADAGQMARAESRWRKKLGLPNGLIARARR
ncbi:MAG: rRNA maturation RNase YbeY [Bryobacterales bacterium]|nr:rRNA maturation RNase YbeY [Bryobacterales bacterium]